MTGQTTIDLSLLFLILSAIAQWVNIGLVNKRLNARLATEDKKATDCGAATAMVAHHITMLATHEAQLLAMKETIGQFRDNYDRGHASLEDKLDAIQKILMGNRE